MSSSPISLSGTPYSRQLIGGHRRCDTRNGLKNSASRWSWSPDRSPIDHHDVLKAQRQHWYLGRHGSLRGRCHRSLVATPGTSSLSDGQTAAHPDCRGGSGWCRSATLERASQVVWCDRGELQVQCYPGPTGCSVNSIESFSFVSSNRLTGIDINAARQGHERPGTRRLTA